MREGIVEIIVACCVIALIGCEEAPELKRSKGASATTRSERSPAPLIDGIFTPEEAYRIQGMTTRKPPPRDETNEVSHNLRAARMGQFLFFDPRISGNGHVTCASCHQPSQGFSVPEKQGQGMNKTARHPPTLINVAYQRFFGWGGKADSLWAQAAGPLEHPDEHGTTRAGVARLIATDPELRAAYIEIFGDDLPPVEDAQRWPLDARPVLDEPSSPEHVKWLSLSERDREQITRIYVRVLKTIAAYEERLVTFDTPFDRYARGIGSGDKEALQALTPEAKAGLKIFVGEGKCVVCHSGPLLSDMAFHNLGLERREWHGEEIDEGRWVGVELVKSGEFRANGEHSADPLGDSAQWLEYLRRTPEDHGQFKTPGLRGVALTAPYMHGGHFDTLADVVRFYVNLDEQAETGHREDMLLPLNLSPVHQLELIAFLESLTPPPFPKSLTGQPDSP